MKNELIVLESNKNDVGKNIARISIHKLKELEISNGDIIEIVGKNKTYAKAMPSSEIGNMIRIDSITRKNSKASINDMVFIKKVKTQKIKSVTLVPYEKIGFSADPINYFKHALNGFILSKNNTIPINIMGTQIYFLVKKIKNKDYGIFTNETELKLDLSVSATDYSIPEIAYEDIGGLKDEIEAVREIIEVPIKHPELFEKLGIGVPKGVLLTGPPGTGKTLLAKAVANETDSNFYQIAGPEIMSKYYGESEKKLREIFKNAQEKSPSIIFIDEIDSIAPKREEVTGEVEKRVVSQLLTLMDGLKTRGNVIVIATTNIPDNIDPALRRPGRFDREIKIMPPDEDSREEILQVHTRGMPLKDDVCLKEIAKSTYGFTGADLELLCKEAAMNSLKGILPKIKDEDKIPIDILENIKVNRKNFQIAKAKIEPSAAREIIIKKPNVKWSDIGGLSSSKQIIKKAIEWPLLYPQYFKEANIKPPRGILLYGPPGCGKTMIAKAIANESDSNFISIKGPEILSKWVGESEKKIREVFKKAKILSPTIVFFDEFDSISKERSGSCNDSTEKIVNQLLTEIDGIEELDKVIVIAATNRKDLIDPAIIRSGRFDIHINIPMPNEKDREEIFIIGLKDKPLEGKIDYKKLANMTKGKNGADINLIIKSASLNAVERKINNNEKIKINQEDLENEIKNFDSKKIEKEKPPGYL